MHRNRIFVGSQISSWIGTTPISRTQTEIGTQLNPATSGTQLFNAGYPSGNYYIKPTSYSGTAKLLYVDNTNQGGGWVLIGKGRASTDDNGGWFGTENDVGDQTGLLQANYLSGGIHKVNSSFVNYLMNNTASGWNNNNANNYLIINRRSDATDGYGGISDSAKIKVLSDSTFKWIRQFGRADTAGSAGDATGYISRHPSYWLGGGTTYYYNNSQFIIDTLSGTPDSGSVANDATRYFQWHWGSHGSYHGWSAGSSITSGLQNASEGHALQFVHVWAR